MLKLILSSSLLILISFSAHARTGKVVETICVDGEVYNEMAEVLNAKIKGKMVLGLKASYDSRGSHLCADLSAYNVEYPEIFCEGGSDIHEANAYAIARLGAEPLMDKISIHESDSIDAFVCIYTEHQYPKR